MDSLCSFEREFALFLAERNEIWIELWKRFLTEQDYSR